MEVATAVLSLLWVIGILNLQRIDIIISDFTRSLASYLSISIAGKNRGMVNLEQYNLLVSKSKQELVLLIRHDILNTGRTDKVALQHALDFYIIVEAIKTGYEVFLLVLTILIPTMELLSFKGFPLTNIFTKDGILLGTLTVFVIATFIVEKIAYKVSNKNYPIRFENV